MTFLCTDKEKSPKEIRPGAPAASQDEAVPSVSSPHRALDQLAGRELRASGSNTVSLKSSRWVCGTRRALRGFKQHLALPEFHSAVLAGFVGSVNTA